LRRWVVEEFREESAADSVLGAAANADALLLPAERPEFSQADPEAIGKGRGPSGTLAGAERTRRLAGHGQEDGCRFARRFNTG
jgi:hypothetical protein